MRAAWHGKRDIGRDPALWALLVASAVLAVLWYRSRPQAGQDVGPELQAPNEWTPTAAETVISSSPGQG